MYLKLPKKIKESANEIVHREKKKEIMPLNKEEINHYNEQKICYICKEKICLDKNDENYANRKKVKDHCHNTGKFRGLAQSICNLEYKVPKEIPIIIHNATYDTHFIMNQLAIEFKGELNYIGDNMEKYIPFSVPIKKQVINNNGDKRTITCKLKFIDSYRFMQNSLSKLVDYTSEIFNNKECKSCIERKKINLKCSYVGLKNDRLIYKGKECRK